MATVRVAQAVRRGQKIFYYCEIKELLQNEKQVLFVGTPCQNVGLRNFLGKDYDNLFLIDFI